MYNQHILDVRLYDQWDRIAVPHLMQHVQVTQAQCHHMTRTMEYATPG
ncbi:MAG: hypothetical protein GY696_28470 [Gammaproteobacteria bacterium]|nr:hypothetical protein [Gammaproteobacteria bacterium]